MAEIYFSYHLIYSGQPVVGKEGKGELLPHLLTQGPRMVGFPNHQIWKIGTIGGRSPTHTAWPEIPLSWLQLIRRELVKPEALGNTHVLGGIFVFFVFKKHSCYVHLSLEMLNTAQI